MDVAQPFLGGVAERLIAPVLKTGRPKGLVSSNLTPSAFIGDARVTHLAAYKRGIHKSGTGRER